MSSLSRVAKIFLHIENSKDIAPANLDELLNGLIRLKVELIVSPEFFSRLDSLTDKRAKISMTEHPESENLDMMILLSPGYNELISNGAVPIISKKRSQKLGLEKFDALAEKGSCFTFEENNHFDIIASVISALETFKFPYDWQNIVRKCKKSGTMTA